jgi:hypothetical protein
LRNDRNDVGNEVERERQVTDKREQKFAPARNANVPAKWDRSTMQSGLKVANDLAAVDQRDRHLRLALHFGGGWTSRSAAETPDARNVARRLGPLDTPVELVLRGHCHPTDREALERVLS